MVRKDVDRGSSCGSDTASNDVKLGRKIRKSHIVLLQCFFSRVADVDQEGKVCGKESVAPPYQRESAISHAFVVKPTCLGDRSEFRSSSLGKLLLKVGEKFLGNRFRPSNDRLRDTGQMSNVCRRTSDTGQLIPGCSRCE